MSKMGPKVIALQELNSADIEFTNRYVGRAFQDGRTLEEMARGILHGKIALDEIPSIKVAKLGTKYFTLDNRRLFVFKSLFLNVPCEVTQWTADYDNKLRGENVIQKDMTTDDDGINDFRLHIASTEPMLQAAAA